VITLRHPGETSAARRLSPDASSSPFGKAACPEGLSLWLETPQRLFFGGSVTGEPPSHNARDGGLSGCPLSVCVVWLCHRCLNR
jgi:hypothetical protein